LKASPDTMSFLSKIIDSVNVSVEAAEVREVLQPISFSNMVLPLNYLVQHNKGYFVNDEVGTPMKEGSFFFRPAGFGMTTKHQKATEYFSIGPEPFKSEDERLKYFKTLSPFEDISGKKDIFSFVAFDVLLYDSIPFFKVLDIKGFPIAYDSELSTLLRSMCMEHAQDKIGKARLLKNYCEEIVIHIFRHIASQPQFEKKIEKIIYLTDKRLVKIIQYISENLEKDLSNKRLAEIAFLSEDYIGQFFKSLTNNNIQDYVESKRLEKARYLLNTTSDNVQEIAFAVGFKDPAYFSRRFKMKFNVNANNIRKYETGSAI
jgi:AraC-like DNA-binding protein